MTYTSQPHDFSDKRAGYEQLAAQLQGLLHGEADPIANAANTAALIFDALPEVSWAGFYFLREGELVVGPFQGKPACVRIALGHGVCGTAAAQAANAHRPGRQRVPGTHRVRQRLTVGSRGAADRGGPGRGSSRPRQRAARAVR